MKNQRGISIYVFLYFLVTLGFVGFIGLKVFTPTMEYLSVKKVLLSMAQQELKDGASVAEIRKGFEKRSIIDSISVIQPADLEITKDGNDTVVTASWTVRLPLFYNASLILDFVASSQ